MNRMIIGITLAAGIVIGLLTGGWFEHDAGNTSPVKMNEKSKGEKKILYWVAPMDPNYRRDKPGKSPMGMDLIPVYEGDGEDDSKDRMPIVRIKPEVINNLGVRTETVKRGHLSRLINTVGYLDYDETLITHVHTRTEGWIERLRVRAEGEQVQHGQLLFELYSPALVNAQEEFLQALAGGNKRLIEASRERLGALDISRSQIDRLEKDRKVSQYIQFFAHQSGVLSVLNVREGMFIEPATDVMSIANLDRVWLLAEVFERQANWVKIGQPAEASLPSMPGEMMKGKVEYIYPDLDPKTRTLRVRMRFDNPDGILMPNMYAHVVIHGDAKHGVLNISREAIIREETGERVIIALGGGRFQARSVVAGIESGDRVEIRSGLEAGELIVVSSQFLIDSESSLKASLLRMEPMAEQAELETVERSIMATGMVRSVDPGSRRMNIRHDPIEALNWPAMTMDFNVTEDVSLNDIQAGDQIHFGLTKSGDDEYVINMIHVMKNSSKDADHD